MGEWSDPIQKLDQLKMNISVDGKIVEAGSSGDILGNPWLSVVNAGRLGLTYNEVMRKGHYLMAGAATSAIFIQKGQRVSGEVETLGKVDFELKNN